MPSSEIEKPRPDWIATDLDGTLFSRDRSEGAVPATWKQPALPGGDLLPSSWIPAPRHRLFVKLVEDFGVVPVTARDADSYGRVNIPQIPFRDGAILSNGAIILRPGTMLPDPDWDAEIGPKLAEWVECLHDMSALMHEVSQGSVVPRLVASNTQHAAYLVAKATVEFWGEEPGLALREALSPFKCRVAVLGRELQVLPPPIGKRIALAAFADLYYEGTAPLMGFGDMPEDLGFLTAATFMAAPSDSTLAGGWTLGLQ